MQQARVANHCTGQNMAGTRNVLIESARIARGAIEPLAALQEQDFDGLILPGGFGAALNLSDFATQGAQCTIQPDVARVVTAMHQAGKPIGALCIAPVILARLFPAAKLTLGNDVDSAQAVVSMGAEHCTSSHGEVVVDEKQRLVTTPCYMLDSRISQIYAGASALVAAVLGMLKAN